jgi:hypothetical protein
VIGEERRGETDDGRRRGPEIAGPRRHGQGSARAVLPPRSSSEK